jgi:hypothetical protein
MPPQTHPDIQPFTICEQRDQFDGAEKLYHIWIRSAQWPQLAGAHENGDIFRRAVQELRHLGSQQPGRQILAGGSVNASWLFAAHPSSFAEPS